MQSNYFRVSILGQLSGNAQTLSSRRLQLFSGDTERVLGALKEMENLHSVL